MSTLLLGLLGCLPTLQAPGPDESHGWRGKAAPELVVEAWLNHGDRPPPTLESLRGRVVMLEFWGTCKKDCMKMEPLAQVLHEKYAAAGLEVLVVSYDTEQVLRDLLTKRSISVPMGSAEMSTYRTWGIPEVPTACVIDADGVIRYHGFPDEVEPAIRTALGGAVDAGALLERWLRGAEDPRETLAQLVALAPRSFDLSAWAREQSRAASESEAAESEPATDPLSAAELLTRAVNESRAGRAEASAACLARLFAPAAEDFDLRAWARATEGTAYPLTAEELGALLADGAFERALDAFCHRRPTPALAELALGDERLLAHCRKRIPEARAFAKKGLMAEHWLFADVRPRRKQLYWIDMGVAFQSTTHDGSPRITIGAEPLDARTVASFVTEQLERVLVASSLAAGRAPLPQTLGRRVEAEREKLRLYLLDRYGVRSGG
ncbi:MAG: TlpA disulfide reductase family protein [Planctomycetota bacterium]|nr:TlpA disulfide reductase family protein [Planctomycetota bacterium]MDP6988314.1 TlpA disulfide reductase family protein [Planctomycetota bacterium]